LQLDAGVDPAIVRGFRNTIEDLELAALQFRDWEMARRSVSEFADSAEVPGGGVSADLGNPPRWVDVGEVAAALNCSTRWVTALCQQGRLAATKHGREWRIDAGSVEDFKRREAA
jgi:excisionase family DNA binding protein